ncbi:HAMP domain-containing protein [Piscinibacter aquaticus]|uniref:HAMP domain-containing protein n=1 Tax=Piscinibacter aquaticus TaxID=392597 RepID=A0A5C6TYR6_9BURK|nr:HAMP domain-containing protein [Piscinibacter aquaticus]
MILASVLAFGLAVFQGRQGQAALAETASATTARVAMVHGMIEAQLQLVSSIRNAGLQTAGDKINADVEAYKKSMSVLAGLEADFARLDVSAQEKELLALASQLRGKADPIVQEAIGYAMAFDGEEAAKTLTTRPAPIQAEWGAALQQLGRVQAERAAAQAAEIAVSNDRRALALASALAVVALAAAAFALMLTRSVTRPLEQAAQAAERVAQGDLSVRLNADGRDEAAQLLRALQSMAEQLAGMVRSVRESSDAIRGAAAEISTGNADLSNRTEQSAASLQEASATLDSLTDSVAENNGHARDASRWSRRPVRSPNRAAARWSRWSRRCRASASRRAASPTSSA